MFSNHSRNQTPNKTRQKQRYISHSLVEVRRFKHLPFFCHSAVLLDVSLEGFKIEFTGENTAHPGSQYWLHIPLTPMGIYAPKRLICKTECRWFDESRFRMGGTFIHLDKVEQLIIEQVIESLKNQEQLLA